MSSQNLPSGWLGQQPKFGDLKLKLDSHKNSEFKVIAENNVIIKLTTGQPTKVVTKFTQVSKDKEQPEYVFVQRKNHDSIHFHLGFPDNGEYQFMIFALPESDSTESLPNVYNYRITVDRIHRPAQPFLKAYSIFFKECCVLHKPLFLNSSSENLDRSRFEVVVPGAQKVAVHAKDEWTQLEKKGDTWVGTADLLKYKGQNIKVTVNASFDKNASTYSVLLETAV
uniref:KY-like immunoglobulin-like domain-containing protein n=1 Tax=Arion vulgaris TaxID=1028688 RepID=A0A0B6Z244_9EUPU